MMAAHLVAWLRIVLVSIFEEVVLMRIEVPFCAGRPVLERVLARAGTGTAE